MKIALDPEKELPPEGKGQVILLPDGQEVAIFCKDGRYYAIDNLCPHEGGPLGEGALKGDSVTCPWHNWQFDIKTGRGDNSYALNVKTFKIDKELDGRYYITY